MNTLPTPAPTYFAGQVLLVQESDSGQSYEVHIKLVTDRHILISWPHRSGFEEWKDATNVFWGYNLLEDITSHLVQSSPVQELKPIIDNLAEFDAEDLRKHLVKIYTETTGHNPWKNDTKPDTDSGHHRPD